MRKISYILSFVLLSAGFVACENEPIDEEVKNDYKQGEQILRFDLNGVTRVAKGNEINAYVSPDGSLRIDVNIKDHYSNFQNISFSMYASDAVKGTYNTALVYGIVPEGFGHSAANLNYAGDEWAWSYNTDYFNQELPDNTSYLELNRGSLTITDINEEARQIEGNFRFELLPPYGLELEPNVPYPSVQTVAEGYFKYITIE